MRESSLQREIDEWFRQSQSLREEGRYVESMRAILTAVELINRYGDGQPHQPAGEVAAVG